MHDSRNGQPPTSRGNSPTTPETAARILGRLFACFPEADLSEETKTERLHGYMTAIEIFEPSVLAEAVTDILQGRALIDGARVNPRFMPTPPEVALLCQEVQHRRFVRTKPRLAYERLPPVVDFTPEEKERRRLKAEAAKRLIGEVTKPPSSCVPSDVQQRLSEIAAKARERQKGVSSKPADQ